MKKKIIKNIFLILKIKFKLLKISQKIQILTHAYNALVDPQTRADYEGGSTQSSAGQNQTSSEDLASALATLAIEN